MRTVPIPKPLQRCKGIRVNTTGRHHLRCHALRLKQSEKFPVYLFSLRADQLEQIADVARIGRTDEGKLDGYQRSIAKEHVKNIATYLNSDDPLFPAGSAFVHAGGFSDPLTYEWCLEGTDGTTALELDVRPLVHRYDIWMSRPGESRQLLTSGDISDGYRAIIGYRRDKVAHTLFTYAT